MTTDEVITTVNDTIINSGYTTLGSLMDDLDCLRGQNGLHFDIKYVFGKAEIDSVTNDFVSEFVFCGEYEHIDLCKVFSLISKKVCKVYDIDGNDEEVKVKLVLV